MLFIFVFLLVCSWRRVCVGILCVCIVCCLCCKCGCMLIVCKVWLLV